MKYSKEKARKRREDLLTIETSLKRCEEACSVDPSELNLENFENMKMKYDSHFEYPSKGAIIHSRANWYEKGEKSNQYFFNLESYRGAKSCIRKVFTSNGSLTSDPKKIMKEIEQFYSDLSFWQSITLFGKNGNN